MIAACPCLAHLGVSPPRAALDDVLVLAAAGGEALAEIVFVLLWPPVSVTLLETKMVAVPLWAARFEPAFVVAPVVRELIRLEPRHCVAHDIERIEEDQLAAEHPAPHVRDRWDG